MSAAAPRILDWRPLRRNSLLGFAKVELPSGMIIVDVTILTGERGPWASPPSKPMLDRDGVVLRDEKNKVRYQPVIEFTSKNVRDRFSTQVIAALRESHPKVLEDAEASA
jgi:hypothetical protein